MNVEAPVTEIFGKMVFSDDIMRNKLPNQIYSSLKKTIELGKPLNPQIADAVAAAMKDWAISKGATHFTHWFQPLSDLTAEKHEAFLSYSQDGKVIMDFSGKELSRGESDASAFPSGGLRQTFEARGYTAWDCTSPAFIKDNTLYIPTVFCSYTGEALDKKTPLLRSMEALNKQSLRLLAHFGDKTTERVMAMVGAEQEYFLIDRNLYKKRLDLLMCGRTIIGAKQPKGQQLNDHYYGKIRMRVSAFMHDLDREFWTLGIPSKIKHNEAAPAQHEVVPVFTNANIACDHNNLMMEVMKKVARKHDLACLLHEKPFRFVNGSGKHCNWSLSASNGNGSGKNLLDPGNTPHENMQFLLILCAIIKGVDEYSSLIRYSVASLSNDERLGEGEAPPPIISVFLGENLDEILNAIYENRAVNAKNGLEIKLGITSLPNIPKDNTDRNRTSPFAFTGNKFELRMCGSSASIAGPISILNTVAAEQFSLICDRLDEVEESGRHAEIEKIIKEIIKNHKKVIYSGNNYSDEWQKEAKKRKLPCVKSSVDSFNAVTEPKVIEMFRKHGVMMESECYARSEISYETYAKTLRVEAETLQMMIKRQVIPFAMKYTGELAETAKNLAALEIDCEVQKKIIKSLQKETSELKNLSEETDEILVNVLKEKDYVKNSCTLKDEIKPRLEKIRVLCDSLESKIPENIWTLPSCTDLMFRL